MCVCNLEPLNRGLAREHIFVPFHRNAELLLVAERQNDLVHKVFDRMLNTHLHIATVNGGTHTCFNIFIGLCELCVKC